MTVRSFEGKTQVIGEGTYVHIGSRTSVEDNRVILTRRYPEGLGPPVG